jgi:hypothetical protein
MENYDAFGDLCGDFFEVTIDFSDRFNGSTAAGA